MENRELLAECLWREGVTTVYAPKGGLEPWLTALSGLGVRPVLCADESAALAAAYAASVKSGKIEGVLLPASQPTGDVGLRVRHAFWRAEREDEWVARIALAPGEYGMHSAGVPLAVRHLPPQFVPAGAVYGAAWLLSKAERPALLAGDGVTRAGAQGVLRQVCSGLQIPLVNEIPSDCDLALEVGFRSPVGSLPRGCRLIWADSRPCPPDREHQPDAELVGELCDSLYQLLRYAAERGCEKKNGIISN